MANRTWSDFEFDNSDLFAEIRDPGCTIRSCVCSFTGEIQIAKVYNLSYIKNTKRYTNQGEAMVCAHKSDDVIGEIQILKMIQHRNCVYLESTFKTEKAQVLIFANAGTPILRPSHDGLSYIGTGACVYVRTCCDDMLQALTYLHENIGVIHRDIKPDNILLLDGVYRLSDFGSARLSVSGQITESPATLGFFPPEICSEAAPSHHCGFKADLWALGLALYVCAFGKLPYVLNNPHSIVELIERICTWSVEEEMLPLSIGPVLKSLLNKNPDKRQYSFLT